MINIQRKTAYKTLVALLVLVFVLSAFSFAGASVTTYSDVMSDLKTDETFDTTLYPENSKDYSLEVITIAESEDRELFIYVYQPADATKELVATHINMSPTDPDLDVDTSLDGFSLYGLTLVDTNGVFDKYVVDNFVTSSTNVRYYNIASIYRNYDKSIDKSLPEGNDNVLNEVAFSVGRCFVAESVDGDVKYYYEDEEVVTITDMMVGNIYYSGGFHLLYSRCYRHIVAFSTDKEIHQLLKARVVYDIKDYTSIYTSSYVEHFKEQKNQVVELSYDDVGHNTNLGLFAKQYEWNRIERASSFVKENSSLLYEDAEKELSNKEWVLSFLETEYTVVNHGDDYGSSTIYRSEVSNVAVLELTFRTYARTYTMGVVSNRQTGNTLGGSHSNCFEGLGELLLLILGICFLLVVLYPFLPYILKFLTWLISLPFKLLDWLVKGFSGKDKGGGKR